MYPRVSYQMTKDDLQAILEACKPTPCIMVGTYKPISQQERANIAWEKLGKKMGFDYTTVRPIQGKGPEFFSAVPSETESQRQERLERESKEKLANEIKKIESEIFHLQNQLTEKQKQLQK